MKEEAARCTCRHLFWGAHHLKGRPTPNTDISAIRSSVYVHGGSRVAFTSCLLAILLGTPCSYQVSLKVCARLPGWRCWCGIQGCYSAVPVDSLWSPTKVSLFLLRWLWSCKSPKRSDQKKIKLQLKKRTASSWRVSHRIVELHIVSQPYIIVLVHIVLLGIVLHIVSLSILLYRWFKWTTKSHHSLYSDLAGKKVATKGIKAGLWGGRGEVKEGMLHQGGLVHSGGLPAAPSQGYWWKGLFTNVQCQLIFTYSTGNCCRHKQGKR